MKSIREQAFVLVVAAFCVMPTRHAVAEMIYVDAIEGLDANPGTKDQPVKTMGRAAEMVNGRTEGGPTTVKLAPGVYCLSKAVEFANGRGYTRAERLTIEAAILPDEPQWGPALMPIILSVEDPRQDGKLDVLTATYAIKIGMSHVTIRGLKFLGNPLARNWHCCVSRAEGGLDDLAVTQCVFVADTDSLDIYCAALAAGDGFVVERCIFKDCHACAVFWDGPGNVAGRKCAMRYCIVDGARIAGVWTCRTAEDFQCHHNIVTRSEYFWMRKRTSDAAAYKLSDCIVTDNRYYSGYGLESGPTGQTGTEVVFEESNVVKRGEVVVVRDRRARDYLHVAGGSFASGLGAGLFGK